MPDYVDRRSSPDIEKTIEDTIERSFNKYALLLFGVDLTKAEGISKIQANMVYLDKARQGSEDVTKIVKKTAIGVFVTSMLALLASGLKQWFWN